MERVGYSEDHIKSRKSLREHNDCTVMSWANCFDCSYQSAHSWLKKYGRPSRRGMLSTDIEKALKACTKVKVKFGPYTKENKLTLKSFVEKHGKGRYYVLVRGHALCVKDGVIYDHCDKPRRQVTFAARIYLEGEI